MSETKPKRVRKPKQEPQSPELVRVNLSVSRELHKKLRIYAIEHGDKSLTKTIQDLLEEGVSRN